MIILWRDERDSDTYHIGERNVNGKYFHIAALHHDFVDDLFGEGVAETVYLKGEVRLEIEATILK